MKYLTIIRDFDEDNMNYVVVSESEFHAVSVYSAIVANFRKRGWKIEQFDEGIISVSPPTHEKMDVSPKKVFIRSIQDEKLEFRLLEEINGVFKKRRFSRRENAVRWVRNFFDNKGFETEARDDMSGIWRLERPFDATFVLIAGTINEKETFSRNRYAKILGVENDASDEEVRSAYRKKSKQHHPDMGGDADEFRKVQEAYENFSRTPRSGLKREFTQIGICRASEFYGVDSNSGYINEKNMHDAELQHRNFDDYSSHYGRHESGMKDIVYGIIWVTIGIAWIGISNSMTKFGEHKDNTIQYGVTAWGVWLVLRGIGKIITA